MLSLEAAVGSVFFEGHTVGLLDFRYLLSYVLSIFSIGNSLVGFAALAVVCFHVGLIGFARIYLGMHTLIDVVGGLMMGWGILAFWVTVQDDIDHFIVSGQHGRGAGSQTFDRVSSFWAALSFLLLFTYPTPEFPTPSFDFHTAFNGVALGIVAGVQQTYGRFHHEHVPRVFTAELTLTKFLARVLVGLPTIVVVKLCSKALAKWILPIMLSAMGFPIRSTGYISALMLNGSSSPTDKSSNSKKQSGGGHALKMLFFSQQDSFDVDTAIRFLQYVGLAWSVVDLVPSLFSHLNL